ncbi:MAG: aminoacetone oxidase family FAD-binding enzyme, partial [Oscillospiraceae bacterium]|nr:aminoacetone oxidase family FAD-binding enzyme [Oscillospiraceae bacterium]
VYHEQGEMLFAHFGVTGPLVLSASAHMRRWGTREYRLSIDLKPALDEEKLDSRILRDFEKYRNRDFANALDELAPRSLIPVLVELSGIPGDTKVHSVTREQRRRLVQLFKSLEIPITGPRPIAEAIVTAGGVSVKEVDPRTMASKLVPGLYFAGELLDVDGYTGGYNLQIAWATGRCAGRAATITR